MIDVFFADTFLHHKVLVNWNLIELIHFRLKTEIFQNKILTVLGRVYTTHYKVSVERPRSTSWTLVLLFVLCSWPKLNCISETYFNSRCPGASLYWKRLELGLPEFSGGGAAVRRIELNFMNRLNLDISHLKPPFYIVHPKVVWQRSLIAIIPPLYFRH